MKCNNDKLETKKNSFLTYLEGCLQSADNLTRVDAMELMQDTLVELIDKTVQFLEDEDELVQVSSLELLDTMAIALKKTTSSIVSLLDSNSWLVRSYAIEYFGDLGESSYKERLEGMLQDAHEEEVSRLYYALIKMGEKKYLSNLYQLLQHDYYRVRASTAALLEKLVTEDNIQEIMDQIRNQLNREKEKSVYDRLESILADA